MKQSRFFLFIVVFLVFLNGLSIPVLGEETYTANKTTSRILVNGEEINFQAYNINGNNYFKLRDIAYILQNTEKPFDITWDGPTRSVYLWEGVQYKAVGGEMATGAGAASKTAYTCIWKLYLGDAEIYLAGYNIDGNNYFKLRDLGQTFDFQVDWYEKEQTITIETDQSYDGPFSPKKNVAVLLYHMFIEEEPTENFGMYTSTSRFEENLQTLLAAGYQPLSLTDFYENRYEVEQKYFVITFDDGYLSNYELAYPILEKYNIYADIFINTDNVYMNHHFKYAQANEMEASGLITINSHFPQHEDVRKLSTSVFTSELARSFADLEQNLVLSRSYEFFAYPYGNYTKERYLEAKEAGIDLQMVQNKTFAASDLVLRTIVSYNSDILKLMQEDIYN